MDSTQIEVAPKTEGTGKLSSFKEFFSSFLSLTKKHFKSLFLFFIPVLVGNLLLQLVGLTELSGILKLLGFIFVVLPFILFSLAATIGSFKYVADLDEKGSVSKKEAYIVGVKNIGLYITYSLFLAIIAFASVLPLIVLTFISIQSVLIVQVISVVAGVLVFILGIIAEVRLSQTLIIIVTEKISFFSAMAKSAALTRDVVGKILLRACGYVALLFCIYIPVFILEVVHYLPVYKTYGVSKMLQLYKSGTLEQFAETGILFFLVLLFVHLVTNSTTGVVSASYNYSLLKDLKTRLGQISELTIQKTRRTIKIWFWVSMVVAVLGGIGTISAITYVSINAAREGVTNLKNTSVYKDAQNGFEITLPASWNYVTAKKPGEPVFSAIDSATAKENIEAGLLPSVVSVEVETVKVGVTAKSVILQNLNKYKIPSTDADFQSGKDESGNEYAMFEGKDENNYVVQKVFVKGDKAYVVSGTGTPTNLQSVIQVGFVISSFNLTGLAK